MQRKLRSHIEVELIEAEILSQAIVTNSFLLSKLFPELISFLRTHSKYFIFTEYSHCLLFDIFVLTGVIKSHVDFLCSVVLKDNILCRF